MLKMSVWITLPDMLSSKAQSIAQPGIVCKIVGVITLAFELIVTK